MVISQEEAGDRGIGRKGEPVGLASGVIGGGERQKASVEGLV